VQDRLLTYGEERPKDEVREIASKGGHASGGGNSTESTETHGGDTSNRGFASMDPDKHVSSSKFLYIYCPQDEIQSAKSRLSHSMRLPPRVVRLRQSHLSLAARRRERLVAKEAWLLVLTEFQRTWNQSPLFTKRELL
jgi:hypothetical protein